MQDDDELHDASISMEREPINRQPAYANPSVVSECCSMRSVDTANAPKVKWDCEGAINTVQAAFSKLVIYRPLMLQSFSPNLISPRYQVENIQTKTDENGNVWELRKDYDRIKSELDTFKSFNHESRYLH